MIAQLPLAGMRDPVSVTVLPLVVRDEPVPAQVVVAPLEAAGMVRLAGSVAASPASVRAKPFVLPSVMTRLDTTFSPTVGGENDSVTVGAAAANVAVDAHAVAPVPADFGVAAGTVTAPFALTTMTAVSLAPAESVTVSVTLPPVPLDATVAEDAGAPGLTVTPPVAVQA